MADNVTDLASYQQWAEAQQTANNAWSAEQAQKQMDFQERMSSTAHQREVADLRAAGLNPVLSNGGSGASAPAGAAAQADTSTASNVGGILQQVLANQSAQSVASMYTAASTYAAQLQAETAREYTSPLGVIMTILGGLFGDSDSGNSFKGKQSAASSAASLLGDAVQLIFDEGNKKGSGTSYSSSSGSSGIEKLVNMIKSKVSESPAGVYSAKPKETAKAREFESNSRYKLENGLFEAWMKSVNRSMDVSKLTPFQRNKLREIYSVYGSSTALKWLRSNGFKYTLKN